MQTAQRINTKTLCKIMNRIILKIELGDWDGGNNGQYPKLIEFEPSDDKFPFYESEGWGHGLGGGRSSLNCFVSSDSFIRLGKGESIWAYDIIKKAFETNCSTKEVCTALSDAYSMNKPSIPIHLEGYLNSA
ncbi:MAG: hypothetical protein ACI8SJ_001915 [Shewanella sp.]|jgi:hypothetical protein